MNWLPQLTALLPPLIVVCTLTVTRLGAEERDDAEIARTAAVQKTNVDFRPHPPEVMWGGDDYLLQSDGTVAELTVTPPAIVVYDTDNNLRIKALHTLDLEWDTLRDVGPLCEVGKNLLAVSSWEYGLVLIDKRTGSCRTVDRWPSGKRSRSLVFNEHHSLLAATFDGTRTTNDELQCFELTSVSGSSPTVKSLYTVQLRSVNGASPIVHLGPINDSFFVTGVGLTVVDAKTGKVSARHLGDRISVGVKVTSDAIVVLSGKSIPKTRKLTDLKWAKIVGTECRMVWESQIKIGSPYVVSTFPTANHVYVNFKNRQVIARVAIEDGTLERAIIPADVTKGGTFVFLNEIAENVFVVRKSFSETTGVLRIQFSD